MNKEKAPEFSSQMDRKTGFPVHPAQQEHPAPDNPGNSIKIISSFPGCTGMTIYVHKSNLLNRSAATSNSCIASDVTPGRAWSDI
jgi:hypothetical protein